MKDTPIDGTDYKTSGNTPRDAPSPVGIVTSPTFVSTATANTAVVAAVGDVLY